MDLSKTNTNNRITSLIKAFEKQILALKELIMEIEKQTFTEQPENGNDEDQNNKK
ncbi:MAG: hypothetical protein Q8933_15315 [Bacteroidota bacterium]|nr:hypothetical protein [Bacteroidota bacterium]MDP4191522.1 hypothetical protein [Bacteroidota bacterium]MDP4195842.1 hypothetical protein [Bacteroidota bacterium]